VYSDIYKINAITPTNKAAFKSKAHLRVRAVFARGTLTLI